MSKVLFITKPFIIEPLGIMYLSANLKKAGHETFWLSTENNLNEEVAKIAPDFVCFSVMTGDQELFNDINKKLKENFNFFSVAGGPHPTFFPDYLESSSFDAIVLGEADNALVGLVDKVKYQEFSVPNCWIKEGLVIHKNPLSCFIENLDTLPFPDRGLIYEVDEFQFNNPIKHFIAGRGCPYNCTYCFNHSYNRMYQGKGAIVRFRSVDNVLSEIEETVKNYPTKFVYFQDDTFILKKEWVKEFAEKYPKRIGLPFHCHIRANLVDEETIGILKEAGCFSVHIAVEAGNERLRNMVLKRSMSNDQILNACSLLHKFGIKFMLQNILGLPTGSLENDFETLELNIQCKPTYAWASIFQPYPGTDLARLCLEEGLIEQEDLDKIQNNFFERSVLKIGNKKEMEYLQKMFAIAVEHPGIYYSGLLKTLLNLPDSEEIRLLLSNFYKSFRKTSDKKLYGMEL